MTGHSAITDFDALVWQMAMGADEAVGDDPADWFTRSDKVVKQAQTTVVPKRAPVKAPLPPTQISKPSPAQPVASSKDNVADAQKLAIGCKSIDELQTALENFSACPLSRTATNLCFLDGHRQAKVLIIGDVPGREEDFQGKPFVGRPGLLLDKMLKFVGLGRADQSPSGSVLMSNLVYWRPPGNRPPTQAEILMCLPFLTRLIELVKPEIVVSLGGLSTQYLTGQSKGITQLRGNWFSCKFSQYDLPTLATLHPKYLLDQPAQKGLAWQDWLILKSKLSEIGKHN